MQLIMMWPIANVLIAMQTERKMDSCVGELGCEVSAVNGIGSYECSCHLVAVHLFVSQLVKWANPSLKFARRIHNVNQQSLYKQTDHLNEGRSYIDRRDGCSPIVGANEPNRNWDQSSKRPSLRCDQIEIANK